MTGVQTITLEDDAQDLRLDRWVRRRFPQINQVRIEKMCRKGEIRLDGGRVKASTRLAAGQVLRLPPILDTPAAEKVVNKVSDADATMIRARVIFRDDDILAIDKPAGLAVQGGSGQVRHLDGMAGALTFDADAPPRLVHRLDRDTSGVMVLARNQRMAATLANAFRARRTRKIYWAAVAGVPHPQAGTIRYGLTKQAGHGPHGAGEKMVVVHPDDVDDTAGAKRAVTDYMVLASAAKRASWVAMAPITGRTHQLRAHIAALGCPIVGDGKYGTNRQTNEGDGWGAQLGGEVSRKLHLHARTLSFDHPKTGRRLTLTANLPDHMRRTWELFGWDPAEAEPDPFEEVG